ncbi:carnitine O-palmitoyltransferase 2, mitochondrial-like [Brevipalpus obovatus]|uniref:carnitine O-palmitoyltransferase 2, mitochondrial-like n=1 Tax=Brevipalpus obovatus TaxID=246614 RepID=UPI003D9E9AEE
MMKYLTPILTTSKHHHLLKVITRCISSDHVDYQYLEKSNLPTNKFEKSLPSLPIPNLSESCERFLESMRAVIDDEDQFYDFKKKIQYFQGREGNFLHHELIRINQANKHTSYISEPWFDMYLSSRTPLPIHYNPFMAWKEDPSPEMNEPCIRAANFVISALRFRRSLMENVLTPEIFHMNAKKSNTDFYRKVMKMTPAAIAFYVSAAFQAFPLDMSQYSSLFNSTRIPMQSKDILQKFPDSKHILILNKGNFYTFDVLNSSGDLKSPEEIFSALKTVWESNDPHNTDSISILTTLDRDEWAKHRETLRKNPQNASSIDMIDSAILTVCLDSDIDMTKEKDPRLNHAHNFLHGCVKTDIPNRPLNRWFDKSFSMIFSKDKQCAINFEHSWGDGVAVLRFFNEVFNDSAKNKFVTPQTNQDKSITSQITRLNFSLDGQMKEAIKGCNIKYQEWTKTLGLDYVLYDKMDRNYFKKSKLSPDSMFQLAFQLAYYKISYGKTPVTYESSSTAAFKHGRTETIRSATMQTKKACFMIHTHKFNNDEIMQAIRECSTKHSELTKNAAMGKGFDRHFFAMKYLAMKKGKGIPKFYEDPNYLYANHFTLSTSTLHGECFSGGGFGPVVPDGFGLGYGFFGQSLGVFCSTYRQNRNGAEFLSALVDSLNQLGRIIESKTPA